MLLMVDFHIYYWNEVIFVATRLSVIIISVNRIFSWVHSVIFVLTPDTEPSRMAYSNTVLLNFKLHLSLISLTNALFYSNPYFYSRSVYSTVRLSVRILWKCNFPLGYDNLNFRSSFIMYYNDHPWLYGLSLFYENLRL